MSRRFSAPYFYSRTSRGMEEITKVKVVYVFISGFDDEQVVAWIDHSIGTTG